MEDPNLVEIFVSANDLRKGSHHSDLDTFAVLSLKQTIVAPYKKIGTTDVIDNSANPQWSQQFLVNYDFHHIQVIQVQIYQKSNQHPLDELNRHELFDTVEFPLATFLKSPQRSLTINLPTHSGHLVVRGGNIHETRDTLALQFSARDLPKVSGFFSTCDPFVTISRVLSDGQLQRVWKNSPIKHTNHPSWPEVTIPLQLLCAGDLDIPLRFELFDWNSNGQHVLIGTWDTTTRIIITKTNWEVSLSSTDSNALLNISNVSLTREPIFLQYLRGGCKLTVSIGIDYTIGNGEPSEPTSYHHWDSTHQTLNLYEQAITAIGSILEVYDDDKMFPVYGFGAKVRNLQTREFSPTQHWFPLSETGEEVNGVNGILELYRHSMRNLQFDQPILLKPLIDHVVKRSAGTCTQDNQKYTILLLFTCGGISDFEESIDSIVHAAAVAPLSIIIAGVGDANFEEMRILDGDVHALQSGNVIACRDIVQFVRLNDFVNKPHDELAGSVLEEIPEQLLSFMRQHRILPNETS